MQNQCSPLAIAIGVARRKGVAVVCAIGRRQQQHHEAHIEHIKDKGTGLQHVIKRGLECLVRQSLRGARYAVMTASQQAGAGAASQRFRAARRGRRGKTVCRTDRHSRPPNKKLPCGVFFSLGSPLDARFYEGSALKRLSGSNTRTTSFSSRQQVRAQALPTGCFTRASGYQIQSVPLSYQATSVPFRPLDIEKVLHYIPLSAPHKPPYRHLCTLHTAVLTLVPTSPGPSRSCVPTPRFGCKRVYTLNLVAPVICQVPYDPMRDTLSHL